MQQLEFSTPIQLVYFYFFKIGYYVSLTGFKLTMWLKMTQTSHPPASLRLEGWDETCTTTSGSYGVRDQNQTSYMLDKHSIN